MRVSVVVRPVAPEAAIAVVAADIGPAVAQGGGAEAVRGIGPVEVHRHAIDPGTARAVAVDRPPLERERAAADGLVVAGHVDVARRIGGVRQARTDRAGQRRGAVVGRAMHDDVEGVRTFGECGGVPAEVPAGGVEPVIVEVRADIGSAIAEGRGSEQRAGPRNAVEVHGDRVGLGAIPRTCSQYGHTDGGDAERRQPFVDHVSR